MKRKPKPPTVPHIPAPGWQQYTPPVGSSFACCCGKAPTWHSGGMIRCDTCVPSASTVAAIVCADCGETGHARCGLAPPAPTVPHIPAPGWQQYTPPVGSSFACCCGKAPTWHSGGMIRCDTCVPSASTVAAIVCADCGETGHARCGLAPPAPTVEGGAKSCATCAHCTAWPGSSPCNSCMRDAAYPNWQPGPAPPPPDDLGEDIGTWTEPGNIPAVFSIRGKPRIYVYNDRPWRVFDERGVCVKVGDDIAPRKRESIAALRAELAKDDLAERAEVMATHLETRHGSGDAACSRIVELEKKANV